MKLTLTSGENVAQLGQGRPRSRWERGRSRAPVASLDDGLAGGHSSQRRSQRRARTGKQTHALAQPLGQAFSDERFASLSFLTQRTRQEGSVALAAVSMPALGLGIVARQSVAGTQLPLAGQPPARPGPRALPQPLVDNWQPALAPLDCSSSWHVGSIAPSQTHSCSNRCNTCRTTQICHIPVVDPWRQ